MGANGRQRGAASDERQLAAAGVLEHSGGRAADRADPNQRGSPTCPSALHYVANANDVPYQLDLLRLLLERGADPTATELDGMTPVQQRAPPPSAAAK
eukprot:SAG22_NODE_8203_length_675_cov_0.861111_1_plen_97_part_10